MNRPRRRFLPHGQREVLLSLLSGSVKPSIDWHTKDFPKQNNFLFSKAPKVLAQCTRRAGKSYGVGKKLVKTALENPNTDSVYIALTRDSAEGILYKSILLEIFNEYSIDYKPNHAKLLYTLKNGSTIKLTGADQSDKEMFKLLGKKFKLVAIDEAAFFKQNIKTLIEEVLEHTLIDEDGQLYMISTTGPNVYSYYYEASTGKVPGWEIHRWTSFDNPLISDKWKKTIERKVAENPAIVKTPSYRRMYLNEWVIDDSLQVYKLGKLQTLPALPPIPVAGAKWNFGLGVDLGWNDDTAFSVVAWHDYSPTLYLVARRKKKGMIFDAVAKYCETLDSFYNRLKFIVVDNANKQGVETMKAKSNLRFLPADKVAKYDNIEIFNSEIIMGRIILIAESDSQGDFDKGEEFSDELLNEWQGLIWDEKLLLSRGVHREDERCANHLADATLYAWRHAYNYTSLPIPEKPPEPGSVEEMDQELERLKDEILRREEDDDYY